MKRWSVYAVVLVSGSLLGTFVARSNSQGQAPIKVPPIPRETASYRDVVKHVLPAVVSIEARSKAKAIRREAPAIDPSIPEELRKFFEFNQQPFGGEGAPTRQGFGSGVLVDPKGVILTNNHVVDGADEVVVELKDGRKLVSKDVKKDSKTDLAIVRISVPDELPYLQLGDSDAMEIGDRVLAVGAPFGLIGSVTHGIVSGKGRSLRMNMYEDFIQTDAAINPGNSGGPLISMEGKVIGINTAIKSRTGGFQGVGLAISSNLARSIMGKLLKDGVVKRGYLGVQIQDLRDPALAERLGVPKGQKGVAVTRLIEGGPAEKGGVKEGDVITTINGEAVEDGREVQRVVAELPLDRPVKVNILRDGQAKTLDVTIEEQPEDLSVSRVTPRTGERDDGSVNLEKLGIAAADLTPELAERLGYGAGAKGALILRVSPDGPAAGASLARGMLITKVDRTPVESAADFRAAAEKASLSKGMVLQVQTPQGGTNFVLIQAATGEK